MVVSVSPRLLDLDSDEEPEGFDPRFALGFRSLSLDSAGYSDFEQPGGDTRAFAGTPDSSATRRKRRQRKSDGEFEDAKPFRYQTVADEHLFRLMVLHPGAGTSTVHCSLVWESARQPDRRYCCLSYAWESVHRDAAILCDGLRLPITSNLLRALQNLRKPKTTLLIWADQICINQDDELERAHQVSIMKHIFNRAHKVYVWLGEADDRSEQLCEYARRMRRGDDNPKTALNRVLSQRELKDSIQKFLQRPWFQRVWVIPEVALSIHTTVVCGRSHLSWDALVRLIRDVSPSPSSPSSFDKQASLLGNPRQRAAIITQIISSQKSSLAHTDITPLLILAKSSRATDPLDMVYAFYSLTHLTTYPDYSRPPAHLFLEVAEMYVNGIQWDAAYSRWHSLDDARRAFQLASILYAAGALHQRLEGLPSWVPDLTDPWRLAPVWCRAVPNFVTGAGRDEWSVGVRTGWRAGGEGVAGFEVVAGRERGRAGLRVRGLVVGGLGEVGEDLEMEGGGEGEGGEGEGLPALRYGRHCFVTGGGVVGIATPGVREGDVLVVVLGADVPVVLRPETGEGGGRAFQLLCEAYVQTLEIMRGEYLVAHRDNVEDIVLV